MFAEILEKFSCYQFFFDDDFVSAERHGIFTIEDIKKTSPKLLIGKDIVAYLIISWMMLFETLKKYLFDAVSSLLESCRMCRSSCSDHSFSLFFGNIFHYIYALTFASLIRLHDKIPFRQIRKIEFIQFFAR